MENTFNIEDCGLLTLLNGQLSKNEERNVEALIMCEEGFKVRQAEAGLTGAKKGDPRFDEFKRTYNGMLRTKQELIAKGLEPSRATDRMSYGDPSKDRGSLSGGYRPDSAIWKAHATIRRMRRQAFDKSTDESLLPSEVGLSNKVWSQLALALHAIPARYRVATESGNLVHNKEGAEQYCVDRNAGITGLRNQMAEDMENARKAADAERAASEAAKAEAEAVKQAEAKAKADAAAKAKADNAAANARNKAANKARAIEQQARVA